MKITPQQLAELRATPVGPSGNRLQKALDLLKVSQVATAKALDKPISYVADTCRGRWRSISVDNAHLFADFIGCHIEDLFPRTDDVTREEASTR